MTASSMTALLRWPRHRPSRRRRRGLGAGRRRRRRGRRWRTQGDADGFGSTRTPGNQLRVSNSATIRARRARSPSVTSVTKPVLDSVP